MSKQKLNKQVQYFFSDPTVRNGFFLAVSLWLISSITLVGLYTSLPPVVPLFYSLAKGPQQLANKEFLFMLPTISFLFISSQAVLAWLMHQQDLVYARIMGLSAGAVGLLFSLALWNILRIVT